jgi:hypothetical protein
MTVSKAFPAVAKGSTLRSAIDYVGDRDEFRIRVRTGSVYLGVQGRSGFDPVTHLRSASGSWIGATAIRPSGSDLVIAYENLPRGDYYLDISGPGMSKGAYSVGIIRSKGIGSSSSVPCSPWPGFEHILGEVCTQQAKVDQLRRQTAATFSGWVANQFRQYPAYRPGITHFFSSDPLISIASSD